MKKNYIYSLLMIFFAIYGSFAQFPAPYCEINEDYYDVEEITTISFDDLSFTNPNTTDILVDATQIYVDVEIGESYTVTLQGNTHGDYENTFVVFVDWNQNGILDDNGEAFVIGTISNSTGADSQNASANITIPSDALTGSTRARIMKVYTDEDWGTFLNIDPCYISYDDEYFGIEGSYGQAIDITVNVFGEEEPEEPEEPDTYCDIDEDYAAVEEITSVEFSDASITNTNTTDIWVDFISVVANVEQGQSYSLTVQGNSEGNFNNEYVAFIDWNQNGILDDEGEVFYIGMITNSNGNDGITASASISVPDDATLGETRIRITKTYTDEDSLLNIDPCYISSNLEMFDMIFGSFGQALDFTVNVEAFSNVSNNLKNSFRLYPNPTDTVLNISGDYSAKEIIVYNMLGQQVLEIKNDGISTVDVSELASGQYIIQINANEGSQTGKFIKK